MPIARVSNLYGTNPGIHYDDSGPVEGSTDYHTIFFFHGSAFNGGVFQRLLPLAPKYNLRFVIFNRRDYADSSGYSEQELDDLRSAKEIHLQSMGVEIATFLTWFLGNHDIPKLSAERTRGGISLLGWSMGIAPVFSFLGHPGVMPDGTYTNLEPYLRTIIIYDAPMVSFGFDYPLDKYNPFLDPAFKTPSEILEHFTIWVSTHYKHNFPNTDAIKLTKNVDLIDFRSQGDNSSILNMTQEEKSACVQFDVAGRSDIGMVPYPMTQSILRAQADRSLYDEDLAQTVLSKSKVIYILCDESPWFPVWGYMTAYEKYEKLVGEGKRIRPTTFVEFPGMNHFGHWDAPERWIELLVGALDAEN